MPHNFIFKDILKKKEDGVSRPFSFSPDPKEEGDSNKSSFSKFPIVRAALIRASITPLFQYGEVIRSVQVNQMIGLNGIWDPSSKILKKHGAKTFWNGVPEQSLKGASREFHRGFCFQYFATSSFSHMNVCFIAASIGVFDSYLNGGFDLLTETRSRYLLKHNKVLHLKELPRHLSLNEFLDGMKKTAGIGWLHSFVYWSSCLYSDEICKRNIKPLIKEQYFEPVAIATTSAIITLVTNPVEVLRKAMTGKGGPEYKGVIHASSSIIGNTGFKSMRVGFVPYFLQNCFTSAIARLVINNKRNSEEAERK